jgi:lipopolysaccharide/colanic/teichoic acid biosynthesis glycosyltransferase
VKRLFDLILVLIIGTILFIPGIVISVIILITSGRPVFFLQERIGKGGAPFKLYKFRSMRTDAGKGHAITVGGRDPRITPIGFFIRKYKIDEWPQLINVLKGDMSLVGPRPEVPRYVKDYSPDQRRVLEVRPGITDMASIKYRHENDLLEGKEDPDRYYREIILADKLQMGVEYVDNRSFFGDLKIMWRTFMALWKK